MRVALIEERVFEDFVSFGETLVDIAEFQCDSFVDVALVAVIVDARRWRGQSFFRVGDRSEEFVFDFDQVQSLEGDQFFAGNYGGDRIANVADVSNAQGLLVLTDGKDSVFDGEIFASENEIDARMRG